MAKPNRQKDNQKNIRASVEAAAQQGKSETALREERVLEFWRERGIFKKTLEKEAPNGEFVFYDGPPFATGLPHMGHLLGSTVKDVIPRYKTMRGYRVRRRWGWDCHGLPIENIVEKKLGLKTKKDIEALGIATFNEEARRSVLAFVHDWKIYIERIGRWVDFDNSYKTMDNTYIESVWWALKQLYEKKLLYEGRKVLMYCPHCETPLAKAEIAMDHSYKDVTDEAVTIKFKVKNPEKIGLKGNVYLLAWTTTPWTLPANAALAVGKDFEYVLFEKDAEQYIVAEERTSKIVDAKIITKIPNEKLVGLEYEPLFDVPKNKTASAYKVYAGDFVTTQEGTGIVHIAPVYGEDDYQLGIKNDLPVVPLLNASGHYNDDAPEFLRGDYFKKANAKVMADLESRGLAFIQEHYIHPYPHCYRCGTALIYNALTSWFINIQKVKDRMLARNESISWHPEHLKHGRFGNIVKDAPDWTVSRNRFWASPLPIWKNEKTDEIVVIGSREELRQYTKKSGNRYFIMRHGEAQNNAFDILSSKATVEHNLTDTGKDQTEKAAEELKGQGITRIIASPFVRTRETACIVQKALGLSDECVTYDTRLGEVDFGNLDGEYATPYRERLPTLYDRFNTPPDGGETLQDVRRRVGALLYELEREGKNETILIVTHEQPWILLSAVTEGLTEHEINDRYDLARPRNAQVAELLFVPLPHTMQYEFDLHRPYIDDVPLVDRDGAKLIRIPEVVDCWMESGSMPFAEYHYPFRNKDEFEKRFPGDFIAEYIAQTRTWFYYMHAVSTALFDRESFKNVVTTGNILAEDGSKMSKSKGNFTDPLINIDRYGSDALRLYLMTSVVMQAEDSRFKDDELKEMHNRFIGTLWNSFSFYTMYKTGTAFSESFTSTHVLDQWILAYLDMTVRTVTEALDVYDTVRAGRALRDFVTDLSTWYIRRSRDRFKSDVATDRTAALSTAQRVFGTLSRLIAPLTPFIAEEIYRDTEGKEESVHLSLWPEIHETDEDAKRLLTDMDRVRVIVSLGLEARARAGIKVRQPLSKLTLKKGEPELSPELRELIKDEVNVSDVVYGDTGEEMVVLDTILNDVLIHEGMARELVRHVQELRKGAALVPKNQVHLFIQGDASAYAFIASEGDRLKRIAGVADISQITKDTMTEVTIGSHKFLLALDRV